MVELTSATAACTAATPARFTALGQSPPQSVDTSTVVQSASVVHVKLACRTVSTCWFADIARSAQLSPPSADPPAPVAPPVPPLAVEVPPPAPLPVPPLPPEPPPTLEPHPGKTCSTAAARMKG